MRQMTILEWNKKRTTESERYAADLADACLYAYTHCYNYLNPDNKPEVNKKSKNHIIQEMHARIVETRRRKAKPEEDALSVDWSGFENNGENEI
jgi:hypothetical protein